MVVFGQGNVKAEWTRVVSDNNNADEEKRLLSETLWSSMGALGLGEIKRNKKRLWSDRYLGPCKGYLKMGFALYRADRVRFNLVGTTKIFPPQVQVICPQNSGRSSKGHRRGFLAGLLCGAQVVMEGCSLPFELGIPD